MKVYSELLDQYSSKRKELQQRLNGLSFLRLLLFALFLFLAYRSTQTGSGITIVSTIVMLAAFFIVVKWYDTLKQKTLFYKALEKWNDDELKFVQTHRSAYPSGTEYEDARHPYSYDMDIFGEGGLFSFLNRCSTGFGRQKLADALLHPDTKMIEKRQEAVKELAPMIRFRQELFAYGSLHQAKDEDLQKLNKWVDGRNAFISKPLYFLLMLFPLATIGSLLYYFATDDAIAFRIFYILFVANLMIAFAFARKITSQLSVSTSVNKLLQSYQAQIKLMEEQGFQSELLRNLQQQLKTADGNASQLLQRLAVLFGHLETIINLMVSILLNGLFLFHIHVLFSLGRWKQQHAAKIGGWLQLIGDMESLSSLAGFYYNNPASCFPQITAQPAFQATDLGHPLIKPEKRITNDISMNEQKFIILTGSNMSGKSTFLRTLGINLILARAGSPVCASTFSVYPFDVFVSMRITDSLQDSESFFYAELKRLRAIMQHLTEGHKTFVILDEILRGTNSNDKRNGTIGLIRKLAQQNSFGIIATHDVVVAELKKEYPGFLANKAFESQIVEDELLFDYKLKDGVCTTLSASYLMKKMGVIE